MFHLKEELKIGEYKLSIFKPELCPYCDKGIDPIVIKSFIDNPITGIILYVAMKCPICGQVFVCQYMVGLSISDAIRSNICLSYNKVLGGSKIIRNFSNEINKVSPSFFKIYNQAYGAEQEGFDEICGMGYRKAFEFLVKDFSINVHPDDKDIILKKDLGKCIKEYLSGLSSEIFERTAWIGNDETHYERKHENMNVEDLKKLIDICISKIEMEIREKYYLDNIEKN